MKTTLTVLVCAAAAPILVGCGGGTGGVMPVAMTPDAQHDYAPPARARHSYAPYATGSHRYSWHGSDDVREIYIGGDLEPTETLRHVWSENGIQYYMGASRDGVGVDRLQNYADDVDGTLMPFDVQPSLYYDADLLDDENRAILFALFDSVYILNDALPPEFQITIDGATESDEVYLGEILVNLATPGEIASICGAGAVACADSWYSGNYRTKAVIYIPDDFDTSEYTYPRTTIVHEFLHALGINGHVDSTEFPDSLMGTAGEYIPNFGYILTKIDREILQILYMGQRSDLYNDWGEWTDTSFHLLGRTEDGHLNFGVALFNGLPQPWVRGTEPNTNLADNPLLSGTATWMGNLIGFSGPSPIGGDAELQVGLATLLDPDNEQDLRFRDIYFLNRFEDSDFSDTSARWFDTRNIDYKVNVHGNGFRNVTDDGYEEGFVTGAFLGPQHEHMGGTVKRTDMVAAFGGTRE